MSADNLWLIRERNGRYYPTMEFASLIVEGNLPEEPKEHDLSFPSWQLAEAWCDEQDRDDEMGMGGTEYGIYSETNLAQLNGIKAADRAIIGEFAERIISALMNAEPGTIPLPGNHLGDSIVIASVIYREAGDDTIPENLRDELHDIDLYTLLVLNDEPPYYTVGTGYWGENGIWIWIHEQDHRNIVPAVIGDPPMTKQNRDQEHRLGYGDLGGDY